MSNFGRREQLIVAGVPVGRELRDWHGPPSQINPERLGSSIIIVLGTDAPLDPRQLERVSVRAGDFVIAFSTTNRVPHFPDRTVLPQAVMAESLRAGQSWPAAPAINYLFQAALEATEEAILNALFAAETMVGRDGHVRHALPLEEVMKIMRRYGRA
jgi:D-aminopeptidase